jgi:hypothetical protein
MSLSVELERLERRLAERRVQTRDELSELLAEDFREVGASGRAYCREVVLERYELNSPRAVVLSNFEVRQLGEEASLATYVSQDAGGRAAHRSSVWVRSAGRWKLAYHQGTSS